MNPMAEARGLALRVRLSGASCPFQGTRPEPSAMLCRVIAGIPGGLTCHDVSVSAHAVAGSVASSDGPREGTATTHTAQRSSSLPVQGVKRGTQHTDYSIFIVQVRLKSVASSGQPPFLPSAEARGLSEGLMHWTDAEYAAYQRRVEDRHPDTLFEPTEADFLAKVCTMLKAQGWLYYHTHDSRKSVPGFPDIVATDGHRLFFLELKTRIGKLTVEQERWLVSLQHLGPPVEAMVIRPHDLEWLAHHLKRSDGSNSKGDIFLPVPA